MLKEMTLLWKENTIMTKATAAFSSMLEDCSMLFSKSWNVFCKKLELEHHKDDIRARDKSINEKEREIRRLLVEHLSLNPGIDSSGCLALMNMVKDAERIGDYSKNIFDLSVMANGKSRNLYHSEQIETIRENIEISLSELHQAFKLSDDKLAKRILDRYIRTKPVCREIVRNIYDEDVSKDDALVGVLLTQYLKRINSHIGNVASGIIFPLDKIDFVRTGLLE
ncbi:MAG: hypothetical protein GF401_01760 [Chitinivibrionales bacterium]|nr:hypothetical protein [Chitinivibrionales bacterium]